MNLFSAATVATLCPVLNPLAEITVRNVFGAFMSTSIQVIAMQVVELLCGLFHTARTRRRAS